MGSIVVLVIFAFCLRFLAQNGAPILWSVGLAAVGTLVIYPFLVSSLEGFALSLQSGMPFLVLGSLAVVGAVAFGAYTYGKRSNSGGKPFKPF